MYGSVQALYYPKDVVRQVAIRQNEVYFCSTGCRYFERSFEVFSIYVIRKKAVWNNIKQYCFYTLYYFFYASSC